MLRREDLWLIDLLSDERSDAFDTMPEIRQWLEPERPDDDELGFRSLLERPDMLFRSLRGTAHASRRRAKRHPELHRAA